MSPGPSPTGKNVRGSGIALRQEDIEVLRRLASKINPARPSVSEAVRWLIDGYVKGERKIA